MHITEYENKQNTCCVNGLLENKVWQEENKFVQRCVYVHVNGVRKQVVLTYIKFMSVL